MNHSVLLSRKAQRAAAQLRHQQGISRDAPICVFDVAEKAGVEVWLRPETSLEGMYSKEQGIILVSAFRPPGRQAFSCAHELGHHVFGHGTRVDLYQPDHTCFPTDAEEEGIANAFAGALLMPISAIRRSFEDRGWVIERCSPEQVYVVAGHLGVGYQTLIEQMRWAYELIDKVLHRDLLATTPKKLRQQLLPDRSQEDLLVVDTSWQGRAVDVSVGHAILLPEGASVEGNSIARLGMWRGGWSFSAQRPGVARVQRDEAWAAFVRVSKKNFTGRSIFRHLGDPDDDLH